MTGEAKEAVVDPSRGFAGFDLRSTTAQRLTLEHAGRGICFRLQPARVPTKTLVIGFHGAIDRATRKPPIFLPALPEVNGYAHQLTISDPGLDCSDQHILAWYAGDRGMAAQPLLVQMLQEAVAALGAGRVICFGTSGGGFAALYYAWHLPGSVALVGNPQTNLRAYHKAHVENYLRHCWDSDEPVEGAAPGNCLDLAERYSEDVPNTVLYFQNPTDAFHLYNQMMPFVKCIAPRHRQRLLLNVVTSGKVGHTPDWPTYAPWLYAAATAASASVDDIVAARYAGSAAPAPAAREPAADKARKPAERDLLLAAAIVRHTLGG